MSSNMWDQIELRLTNAMDAVKHLVVESALFEEEDIYETLRLRYEAGSAEHNDEWYNWEMPVFWENIKEEIFDMVLYTAMNMVRNDEARKYGMPEKTSINDSWNYRASLGTCPDANMTESGPTG